MTTGLNRIVSQGTIAAFVAVLACSSVVASDKTTHGAGQSSTITIADLDPLCGHHYPT